MARRRFAGIFTAALVLPVFTIVGPAPVQAGPATAGRTGDTRLTRKDFTRTANRCRSGRYR
jgi:hypothetical protein